MKKLQIIKNSKNEIIGTTTVPIGDEISASIVSEKGQKVFELEVPDDYVLEEKRKLQLVKDSKGKIIASFETHEEELGVPASIELGKTQYLEEVKESGLYILDVGAFYKRHTKK